MIYAEEHISVLVLKDEIGGDQQKEEPEFFFSYMIIWTNIGNWLKYLWIKFQPFQCGFIFLFQDQFDSLDKHTQWGIDFLERYAKFVKERIEIEQNYAKQLR